MSNAAERSEIAVLQTQMKTVQGDISEIKGDMKDIKVLLLANSSNTVNREEFDAFKKSIRINYVMVGIASAIVTAMAYALIVGRTH